MSYLNPESLSEEEAKRIFASSTAGDGRELAFAHAALESIRKKRLQKVEALGGLGMRPWSRCPPGGL